MRGVLLLALLLSSAAAAQPRLERVSERITQCVIDRNPEGVRRWMSTLPGSREELQVAGYSRWVFTTCLSAANGEDVWNYQAELQSSRERVAVGLLAKDFPTLPETLPPAPAAGSWIATSTADIAQRRSFNRGAVQMLMFGDCLARTDWPSTASYLRSAPDSAEERDTLRALHPHMAGCLPPGLTATIERSRMRTLLSEAVYHILVDGQAAESKAG
jgi:hypothetical protein